MSTDAFVKYPYSIHMGSRKDAGLCNLAKTLGAAKRMARSESSKFITGETFSVFTEDGTLLALYKHGQPVPFILKARKTT